MTWGSKSGAPFEEIPHIIYIGCPSLKNRFHSSFASAHKTQIGVWTAFGPIRVEDATGKRSTGSSAVMGSWKRQLGFKTVTGTGHEDCAFSALPYPYTPDLKNQEAGEVSVFDEPDVALFYHTAHDGYDTFPDAAALRELGIPTLDIISSDLLAERPELGDILGLYVMSEEAFFGYRSMELHLHLVELSRPYAERARRAAWECRNQQAVYGGPWWGEEVEGKETLPEYAELDEGVNETSALVDEKKRDAQGLEDGDLGEKGGFDGVVDSSRERRRRRFAALPIHAKICLGVMLLFFWTMVGRRLVMLS